MTALVLALSLLGLAGCDSAPALHLDPLSTSGWDGGEVSFATVMRLAAVARASGDYGSAVGLYRHAATLAPRDPNPLVGLGGALLEMGQLREAIDAFNSALSVSPRDPGALRGLAKVYLKSGRPELSGGPLGIAYQDTPQDPKLLLLIGVADDFIGQHVEAQKRYRAGLAIAPGDRSLSLDLALSLALSESFDEAINLLRPIAYMPGASPLDRQTLALIYGLKGDQKAARRLAQIDLDAASVEHNLAFYETLRHLQPDARSRAVLSASAAPRSMPQS